ncbi:MAG: SDR family NAD(P)-dependent oxidoreductase [Dehalococcoidia bacterium]
MRLEGKVAIVTGASRGLGEYTAVGLAQEGAAVVVAARTEKVQDPRLPGTIHDTVRAITAAGGRAIAVRCNVASEDDCTALAEATVSEFGRIDILVNNAGIQAPGTMGSIQPRHWELEFKVNVHGTFHCTRAVLPTMLSQRSGVIVNISSAAADTVGSGSGHYGVSKVAVESLTRAFAVEVAPSGIAVLALKPKSAVETPGMRFAWAARGAEMPSDLPPKDDYVEAATILCTATPSVVTGEAFTDEQVIARFGRGALLS